MARSRIIAGLFFASATAVAPALAHDFWLNDSAVDPWTKRVCCGKNDARILDPAQVHVTPRGYKLDDTQETVPFERAQPSPDGQIWAFRWAAMTQCFFVPKDMI